MAGFDLNSNTVFTGVEVQLRGALEPVFHITQLVKKKEQLEILKQENNFSSVQELSKLVKGKPVVLVITGRGIISKKITQVSDNIPELMNQVLPNASAEEFYFQRYHSEALDYGCVSRKETINSITEILSKEKIQVQEIFLGALVLTGIKSVCWPITEDIHAGPYQMKFKANRLEQFISSDEKSAQRINLGTSFIEIDNIISFAAAFVTCVPVLEHTQIDSDALTFFTAELKQKKIFRLAVSGVIVLFLVVLLGNLFVSQSYSEKYHLLSQELTVNENSLGEIEKLKADIAKKKELAGGSIISGKAHISFYADQLASTVPYSVSLDKIELNPIEKKIRTGDKIEISNQVIEVMGIAGQSTILNEWIKTLKDFKWIKDITIHNYSQDDHKTPGEFALKIVLK